METTIELIIYAVLCIIFAYKGQNYTFVGLSFLLTAILYDVHGIKKELREFNAEKEKMNRIRREFASSVEKMNGVKKEYEKAVEEMRDAKNVE